MVLLQLRCWRFSHTKKLCRELYSIKRILSTKTTNSYFKPPFVGVRDNVRTSSIARWKARGRLPIRYNWKSLLLRSHVINGYWSKSAFCKGGQFKRKFQVEGDIAHQPIDDLFMWCQNVSCMFFRFITKHACDGRTDRWTDGQNYDLQDRASIADSFGNKNFA